jgi:PKD repeat protein
MKNHFSRSSKYVFGFIAFSLALSLALLPGNGTFSKVAIADAGIAERSIVLDKEHPLIRTAIKVQNKHTQRLMVIDGVVGTGTGVGPNGQPIITVFTKRAGVPGIPMSLEGVPVRMQMTGMIIALADPTARFPRPVPIGVSTGHPDITAGTIGCRVKGGSGAVYALSNNHVYANGNDAYLGDSALQPGPSDGGVDPGDSIGSLADFEPINFSGANNYIDAAIVISSTADLDCWTPSDGYGVPGSVVEEAFVGQQVQKYGRTTGWTHGEVSEINVTVDVCYQCTGPFCLRCKKLARFVDQIAISSDGGGFSAGGDSGSLIVTDDGNKNPVGLLFAGSSTLTFANRIQPVFDRFNVSVDSTTSSPSNSPPTADFTFSTIGLEVTFTDKSSDPDNDIATWNWDFGDLDTSTDRNPVHTYATGGTYTVTLTVTDSAGATSAISHVVAVSDASGGITLTATGYKVKGRQKADLEWSGTSGDIDIYRDGSLIKASVSGNSYTDNIDRAGGGSYTYQVCETGSGSPCSNEATVTF